MSALPSRPSLPERRSGIEFRPNGFEKGIIQENLLLLKKACQQRDHELADLLCGIDADQLQDMASATMPLFCIRHAALYKHAALPTNWQQRQDQKEIFLALTARRDAYINTRYQANITYQLSNEDAAWLTRQTHIDLFEIANDPLWSLRPSVHLNYFKICAAKQHLSTGQRTALAVLSRTFMH